MSSLNDRSRFFSYMITDGRCGATDLDEFYRVIVARVSDSQPDYLLYRDKGFEEYDRYAYVLKSIGDLVRVMVHQNIDLAKDIEAFGVHLTSLQFEQIGRAKSLGLFTVVSTHTKEQVELAVSCGADAVTYSPIFYSPNKTKPLGLESLNEIVATMPIKIIALGGIVTQQHVDQVRLAGADGFASIRYFDKDFNV